MSEKKEKLSNSLTSKENLSPPNLIRNPKERNEREVFDVEGEDFFNQFEEDVKDLKTTDASLQVLLRKKMINLDEPISSAREKINNRITELEDDHQAFMRQSGAQNPETKNDGIDNEFYELMSVDKDNIKTTYRVLGHLLRAGMVSESDVLVNATQKIYSQIKKFAS